jgi:D-amino peptidase
VLNFTDWCLPESRYYETAKELLTREVNAAVEGFFAGGATAITVVDGHGAGAINPVLLDPRVELMRGFGMGWPFLLDEGYDAVAWVGQHAKAGTPYAHLAHTQSFSYVDLAVNGISIGEFGQLALCADELGVTPIFFAGDRAGCEEAQWLVPGIETAGVKRGTNAGKGDELDTERYMRRNTGAIHVHPERARALIRAGAERAMQLVSSAHPSVQPKLVAPFERVAIFRADGDQARTMAREVHPDSVIGVMNMPFAPVSLSEEPGAAAAK